MFNTYLLYPLAHFVVKIDENSALVIVFDTI